MSRWTREEIEEAFDNYQATALKGCREQEWRDWADCFTEDATYVECHMGKFWGRENIYNWIQKTMTTFPASHMTAFPIAWYTIDVEKGWVIAEVFNRMEDLHDGEIHEETNICILHYAGHGLFSYEEDVYNPEKMGKAIARWVELFEKQKEATS